MSDTPETNECVKKNKHIRFLEEDHLSLNGKFTFTHPIVALCRKLERERDGLHDLHNKNANYLAELLEICGMLRKKRNMYERQVAPLIKRLGKMQEHMIDAERILNKIYIARNITHSEESMLSALAEIDKTCRTQNDGN